MTESGCGCDEIILPLGANGLDGGNAFNRTTGSFVQPPAGAPAIIPVSNVGRNNTEWAAPGQIIIVSESAVNYAYYQVTLTTPTTIRANNLDYPGTIPAGNTVNSPATVAPAGPIGANGTPGTPGTPGAPGAPGTPGGIGPQGPAAATLQHTYVNTTVRALPGGTFNIIPVQTFSAPQLCVIDGDAARIKGSFNIQGTSTSDRAREVSSIVFNIGKTGIGAVPILPTPSSFNPSDDDAVQIKKMLLPNPGQPGFVDFEIMLKRVTSTTSLITVSWSVSGIKAIGPQCVYTGASTTTGSLDFIAGSSIDFSVTSSQNIPTGGIAVSATTLTVEKINQ